jgi:hypothetical protein
MAVEQAEAGYRVGDAVWLEPARDRLHFFKLESGTRLAVSPAVAGASHSEKKKF